LRIFVQILHVRVRRRAIQVEVILFDILAVVAFAVGQAEESLLEDRITTIPQGQGKTEKLLVVADTSQAILAPVVGARAGLVMAEVAPGVFIRAVVLANRSPLPFAEVGTPFSPRGFTIVGFL
jgi:hypothetical protein